LGDIAVTHQYLFWQAVKVRIDSTGHANISTGLAFVKVDEKRRRSINYNSRRQSIKKFSKRASCLSFILSLAIFNAGSVSADSKQATYKLDISVEWSASTAPFEFPEEAAHLSSLVGLTHTDQISLFADGETASSGLELVAENGRAGILKAQIEEWMRKDRVGALVEADGIKSVPGNISTTFKTTVDHPLLSVITMVAPSPDWFTGVSAVPLYSDDGWVDTIELPLWVWDAGTDSGTTFYAKNADTQPHESIRLLATSHFFNSDGLIKFGTITIERKR